MVGASVVRWSSPALMFLAATTAHSHIQLVQGVEVAEDRRALALATGTGGLSHRPPPSPSPPPPTASPPPPSPLFDDEGEEGEDYDELEDYVPDYEPTWESGAHANSQDGGAHSQHQQAVDAKGQALLEMHAAPVTVIVGLLALGLLTVLLLALLFVGTYRLTHWWIRHAKVRAHGKPVRLPTAADDEDDEEDGSALGSRASSRYKNGGDVESGGRGRASGDSQSGSRSGSQARGSKIGSTTSGGGSRASGSRAALGERGNQAYKQDDDDASEVASRLATRMNALLDQLAQPSSRRRHRIDTAVRRELQGGADPVDILEALELEIEMRQKRKAVQKGADAAPTGAESVPLAPPDAPTPVVPVTISANNMYRLTRIHEAEDDQMSHLSGIKKAAAHDALKEEQEFQARLERGSVVMQNILKDLDDDEFDDPQDALQPWDSISNVLPSSSDLAQMQRAHQQRALVAANEAARAAGR
uniref:Uncharacterized protein n=1 Tax=Coccolithus braarudii TaxID=221442 RepID=A0A7S0PYU3_9EUKA|mmetsp:Transcript_23607/g.50858  ORF Transcript_23607/g.50858 Transcript_23607/m.50858 type:complete len:474 (+) Transcript_23607:38-1459(+)|eukprot:CAMPEP_0183347794 /NCGR_PEP_ID=MMETSP0164_2-20130417/12501_1 /TAXON_ID=221442 /ORGANISM="Coccolithus pelagicus ssp braarudi, Strain PLY182g" /LENGTH=473 /DNA_ID=CAMNT_0025519285 /DNA_START=25 /DNA_END=1446 /DNA_ORIENTATION=-